MNAVPPGAKGVRSWFAPARAVFVGMTALTLACGSDSERSAPSESPTAGGVHPMRPDTVPAVDMHVHIRSLASAEHLVRLERAMGPEEAGPASLEPYSALGADDALAALDRAGIQRALVLSNAYMFGMPDVPVDDEARLVRAENDYVAAEVARFPARLVGACSVNPLRAYAAAEVGRCARELGLSVLKLYLTNSDVDLREATHISTLHQVFDTLAAHGMGAIVHMRTRAEDYGATDALAFIDGVLEPFPSVPVHIAHMAGWGGYDDATDAVLGAFVDALSDGRLADRPVWFGLGAVVFQPEAAGSDTALVRRVREANTRLADRVRALGLDRVVYATDWPSWPPVPDIEEGIAANVRLIRSASGLTATELAAVFGNEGLVGVTPGEVAAPSGLHGR